MGRGGKKLTLLLAMVVFTIMVLAVPALAAWPVGAPTEAQWIPVFYKDWNYLTDPAGDTAVGTAWSDAINAPGKGAAFWYFDDTNVYFRMVLDGEPLVRTAGVVTKGRPEYYHVGMDFTGDNNYEWYATLYIAETLTNSKVYTQYNLATGKLRDTDGVTGFTTTTGAGTWSTSGLVTYLAQDHARITSFGTDAYLDFWIPLTWLARSGGVTPPYPVSKCDQLKMIFGTANHTQHICDDLVGSPQAAYQLVDYQNLFANSPYFAFCQKGYGVLRDIRTSTNIPNSGSWNAGETLVVSGYGWPTGASPFFNGGVLPVAIVPPGGTIASPIWTGTVTSDATGAVANTVSWPIPISATLGVYSIYVADPLIRPSYSYVLKDTFTVAAPSVTLNTSTKTVNLATATGGNTLVYTITVRNSGASTIPAGSISVQDSIPAHTTYVLNSTKRGGVAFADVGGTSPLVAGTFIPVDLASGGTYVYEFSVTVNASTPDQTIVVNSAMISWGGFTDIKTAQTLINQPGMAVTKTSSPNQISNVPASITYTVQIINTGHIPLTGLTLSDSVVGITINSTHTGDGGTIGTLDIGETWTYVYTYNLNQNDYNDVIAAGPNDEGKLVWQNTATADCAQLLPVEASADVEIIAWSIDKTVNPLSVSSPGTVTYTVTLVNLSPSEIKNVGDTTGTYGVFDSIMGRLTRTSYIGDSDNKLEAGETWYFTYTYSITQAMIDAGPSLVNTATAVSSNVGSISHINTLEINQNPTLSLTKNGTWVDSNSDGYADVGEPINYTFTVTNSGNITLHNVTLTDPAVTISGSPIATLNVGASNSVAYTGVYYVTQADLNAGHFLNTATTDSDESMPATGSRDVTLPYPKMSVIKAGTVNDTNSNGRPDAGETIGYTFSVTNTGNVTLINVTITDPKVTVAGGPIGSLVVGATDSATFTASYTITQADIDAGSVVNTATGSASGSDLFASNTLTVTLTQVPSVSVDKTVTDVGGDGPSGVVDQAGEVISYQVVVTNTGNRSLTGNLADSLPGISPIAGPVESSASNGILTPGETWTYTYTYTALQTDIDNNGGGDGYINNTATFTPSHGSAASDSAAVQVGTPVMTINKEAFDTLNNPITQAQPGTILVYSVTFTNVGTSTATAIVMTDVLPAEVTYIPGSCTSTLGGGTFTYQHTSGGPYDGSDALPVTAIMYTLASMAPGATCTVRFQAQIK